MKSPNTQKFRLDMAKHCFISRGELNQHLAMKLFRDPNHTAIKVFDQIVLAEFEDLKKHTWGDDPAVSAELWEATQIQNICAMHGLAPRVYALTTVAVGNKIHPAQFTEYVHGAFAKSHDEAIKIYKKIEELGETFGFKSVNFDVNNRDVVAGRLVDFQTFKFDRPYEETVRGIYLNDARYGKVYYQSVKSLGLKGGPRLSEKREEWMKLDSVDFQGKKVLDIGCAGGHFTRNAVDRGANVVVGVDLLGPVIACSHVANLEGYFNIEYICQDLNQNQELAQKGTWDVIFFLSMNMHLPNNFLETQIRSALQKDGVLIMEKNGKMTDEHWEERLNKMFESVELVGRAEDQANCQKPIFICRNKK